MGNQRVGPYSVNGKNRFFHEAGNERDGHLTRVDCILDRFKNIYIRVVQKSEVLKCDGAHHFSGEA